MNTNTTRKVDAMSIFQTVSGGWSQLWLCFADRAGRLFLGVCSQAPAHNLRVLQLSWHKPQPKFSLFPTGFPLHSAQRRSSLSLCHNYILSLSHILQLFLVFKATTRLRFGQSFAHKVCSSCCIYFHSKNYEDWIRG